MDRNDILGILMPERTKQIGFAWSILRESHFAEDAYQDMLKKVFENQDDFEGPKHLRDWSWKVLRNRCYELVRINKTRTALLEDAVLDLVDSELESRDTGKQDERADALRACLDSLTENSRNIVQMRFFEGLPGKEVAAKLGRKPDAIYKNLQRIYSTLGECIRRQLNEQGLSS
ncbi:MAG: sigma-70 family RNA polymerase sigma factor [Verrucomicrobiales bacterium]|nr:sigma-70 family RNA polymerase sigma factor [Verrucomicrobiales bacterium]